MLRMRKMLAIRDKDKIFTSSVFLESRMEGIFIQRCDRRDIS